jgi:hypothetical protein
MMRRLFILFMLLFVLVLGAAPALAQPGDRDGDGIPRAQDNCPFRAGPASNNGCPLANADEAAPPPAEPEPPAPPPEEPQPPAQPPAEPPPVVEPQPQPQVFMPAVLPLNGCYITSALASGVNVRSGPGMEHGIVGNLLPSVVYAADGFVLNGAEPWFRLAVYEGATGAVGYSSGSVLSYTTLCPQLVLNPVVQNPASDFTQNPTPNPLNEMIPIGGEDTQALQCFTRPGTTVVESCWCPSNDTVCVQQLTSICYGAGAYIENGLDMTACWYGENAPVTDPAGLAALLEVLPAIDYCADDLTVWWADVPNPYGDPFQLHDIDRGICGEDLSQISTMTRPAGTGRLIARLSRPEMMNLQADVTLVDCDLNGALDHFEALAPPCAAPRSADKELVSWWAPVLDLTCGGTGWIMQTEIDAAGDEIVTKAHCDD